MRVPNLSMYGSYHPGGSPQTPRSANMSSSVSTQGNMQGIMYDSEPTINFVDSQSPRGMYPQQYSQPCTPSTVRSAVQESIDTVSGNMPMTPSFQGMGAETG